MTDVHENTSPDHANRVRKPVELTVKDLRNAILAIEQAVETLPMESGLSEVNQSTIQTLVLNQALTALNGRITKGGTKYEGCIPSTLAEMQERLATEVDNCMRGLKDLVSDPDTLRADITACFATAVDAIENGKSVKR